MGAAALGLASYYRGLPDEIAQVERIRIKAETFKSQQDQAAALAKHIDACTERIKKLVTVLEGMVTRLNAGEDITKEDASLMDAIMRIDIRDLAATRGAIKGFSIHPTVDRMFRGLDEIYAIWEAHLPEYQDLFNAYTKDDPVLRQAALKKFNELHSSPQFRSDVAELGSIGETLTSQFPSLSEEFEAEVNRDVRATEIAAARMLLAIGAMAFCTFFIGRGFKSVLRDARKMRRRRLAKQNKALKVKPVPPYKA
ncbi:MAG TPA: hypothetical protein VI756_23620 [Blastocatellia bacterium]